MTAMGVLAATGPASAATVDIGKEGPSFAGVTNPPTADKPQSKMWFAQNSWWADMFDTVSGTWHIFRLDQATETWVDTGVQIDDRANTLADVLWDGSNLYVASHVVTDSTDMKPRPSEPSSPARLYRYSWTGDTYTLDAGFPTTITDYSSESLTIDKDSTGTVWATWTQVGAPDSQGRSTGAVYVNSAKGGTSWGEPFVLPASDPAVDPGNISSDDISSVVAFGGNRIGVIWSDQLTGSVYWAVHKDGAAPGSWDSGVAAQGDRLADDHVNIKAVQADDAGRVFAVVKTGLDTRDPKVDSDSQVLLLSFDGKWSQTPVATVKNCWTRPMLMLDEADRLVHVFGTAPNSGCSYSGAYGTIFEKSFAMDNPAPVDGRGRRVILDADSAHLNNVTSTKQSATAASGLVVLASNDATQRYWHADIHPPKLTASFTSAQGETPLQVAFTDTSTGAPASWAWDFGDGDTSTERNPQHTYASPGDYTVSLTATNAGGTSQSASATVTVTAPPAGGGGTDPGAGGTDPGTGGGGTDPGAGGTDPGTGGTDPGTGGTDPGAGGTDPGTGGTDPGTGGTDPGTGGTDPGTGGTDPGTGGTDPGTGGTDPATGGTDPGTAPGPAVPPSTPTGRTGSWFYLNDQNSGRANIELSYGDPSDRVLVADTDGRNGDSLLIRRGNRYFVRNTLTTGVADDTFVYGNPDDVVLVGDWNGDGVDTLAVRRGNSYFIRNSLTSGVADQVVVYGNPDDVVLVGDWNGDGVDTLAVRRGNSYFIRNSLTSGIADRVVVYGNPDDVVLVGRWNGRSAGLAVQRGNVFYLKNELTSGVADVQFAYGNPGDTVLVGDWNGDGVDSLGVRRNG